MKDFLYNFLANVRNRHVPTAPAAESAGRVRIAVMQHFPCDLPPCFADRTIYFPLLCGRSSGEDGTACDATGDNISRYNPFLNEMTGIYWMARHDAELGAPDFIGVNHYRRFLEWSPSLLAKGTVVATSTVVHHRIGDWLRRTLGLPQLEPLLDRVRMELEDLGLDDFAAYLGSHTLYPRNMFIMDRETFFRYFAFMERFLALFREMVDSRAIPLDDAKPVERRLYGYVLEQLTSYWIYHARRTGAARVVTTYIQDFAVAPRG